MKSILLFVFFVQAVLSQPMGFPFPFGFQRFEAPIEVEPAQEFTQGPNPGKEAEQPQIQTQIVIETSPIFNPVMRLSRFFSRMHRMLEGFEDGGFMPMPFPPPPPPQCPLSACRHDVEQLCDPSKGFMAAVACLVTHEAQLSHECREVIDSHGIFWCAPAAQQFCPGAMGPRDVADCLREHTHELPPQCVSAMEAMHKDQQDETPEPRDAGMSRHPGFRFVGKLLRQLLFHPHEDFLPFAPSPVLMEEEDTAGPVMPDVLDDEQQEGDGPTLVIEYMRPEEEPEFDPRPMLLQEPAEPEQPPMQDYFPPPPADAVIAEIADDEEPTNRGGMVDVPVDKDVLDAARFAAIAISERSGSVHPYVLADPEDTSVVRSQAQVVAGTMYLLTLRLKMGQRISTFDAKVWVRPWLSPPRQLMEYHKVGHEENDGGMVDVPVDENVLAAARFAAQAISETALPKYSAPFVLADPESSSVIRAQAQVVAGTLYLLSLRLERAGQGAVYFDVRVWVRPWLTPQRQLLKYIETGEEDFHQHAEPSPPAAEPQPIPAPPVATSEAHASASPASSPSASPLRTTLIVLGSIAGVVMVAAAMIAGLRWYQKRRACLTAQLSVAAVEVAIKNCALREPILEQAHAE